MSHSILKRSYLHCLRQLQKCVPLVGHVARYNQTVNNESTIPKVNEKNFLISRIQYLDASSNASQPLARVACKEVILIGKTSKMQ